MLFQPKSDITKPAHAVSDCAARFVSLNHGKVLAGPREPGADEVQLLSRCGGREHLRPGLPDCAPINGIGWRAQWLRLFQDGTERTAGRVQNPVLGKQPVQKPRKTCRTGAITVNFGLRQPQKRWSRN